MINFIVWYDPIKITKSKIFDLCAIKLDGGTSVFTVIVMDSVVLPESCKDALSLV